MFLIINKITCTTNLNLTSMDDREYNVESNQPHGIEITPVSERVATVKHNSNLLIEDRYTTRQLKNFNGYFLAVLDGHGGAQLAEFANSQLADWFDINYLATKAKFYDEDESVVQALKLTFLQIEQAYLKIAKKKFQLGDGISSTAGSCVTAVLVSQKKIYSAQLGDSKARIFTKINNFYIGRKITTTHNCKTKNEMDRLKTEFPNEQDIVVCKFNKVCYVKGRLQPTRSLGDYHLKYKEFNDIPVGMGGNYRLPLQNFNGPYIKAEPEIQIHDITVDDAYLVLATDGLWDYLKTSHIELLLDYYKPKVNHLKEIADYLFNWVMQLASKKSGVPLEDLMRMPGGPNKRAIHDDITIIVFSFKNKK